MFKLIKFLVLFLILNSYQVESNTLGQKFSFDDNSCGIMSEAAGLIHGGEISQRNQFPWMAIISLLENDTLTHFGSGSLISHRHVITWVGSVSFLGPMLNYVPVAVDRVKVFLGTTEYGNLEPGSLKAGVIRIANYPYARRVSDSLSVHQFSVVTLDQDVAFTQFISPVCLWPFKTDLSEIVGKEAYAVGHGRDRTGKDSLFRKQIRVKIEEKCDEYFAEPLQFQNETKLFCVKSDENEGPCVKDHPLYMKIGKNWFLKGMLATYFFFDDGTCNVNRQTLYEDIEGEIATIQLLMLE